MQNHSPIEIPTEVICYLDSGINLYHASNFIAGLCGLHDIGVIRLRIETPGDGFTSHSGNSLTLLLSVKYNDENRKVAVDLFDRSDRFTLEALQDCDIYFKRSYYGPDIQTLPHSLRRKIIPFGLNYACRSAECTSRIVTALGRDFIKRVAFDCRGTVRWLRETGMRTFWKSPRIEDFEQLPSEALDPLILYQPRLWEPHELGPGEDSYSINESRIAIVRALKKWFGRRFVGGLLPTPLALSQHRDLVSSHPNDRRAYIRWSKRCLIAIHTRGLHYSHPFKLPEYISAAQCIVSPPIRNELPVHFEQGRHYLEFRDPGECIEQCARILRDRALANHLRLEVHQYYLSEVHPVARAAAVIEKVKRHRYDSESLMEEVKEAS